MANNFSVLTRTISLI